MKLLQPGTGHQAKNRKSAIKFIADKIIDADSFDLRTANITSKDGSSYQVSAYAETPAAFISTPGENISTHSIYESGLTALMFRQLKNDKRTFIYEVDPSNIFVKNNSNSANWLDIEKVSNRIWVCMGDKIKCFKKH